MECEYRRRLFCSHVGKYFSSVGKREKNDGDMKVVLPDSHTNTDSV